MLFCFTASKSRVRNVGGEYATGWRVRVRRRDEWLGLGLGLELSLGVGF